MTVRMHPTVHRGISMTGPRTMYEKIYENHLILDESSSSPIIYIDRQLIHEVTSPQAFDGLRMSGRPVRRPDRTYATMDHNVSTSSLDWAAAGEISRIQMETLKKNCQEFGITLYEIGDRNNGIVHVMGPEQGLTLPGMTIVCGDSHTATHGAFGALAFGIGTSEVEHVLATQTLPQGRSKNMLVRVNGKVGQGVSAKDIILAIIGEIGTDGGTGFVIEFAGEAIEALSMEARMTVCNMAIEAGARAGLIAPDEKTFEYLRGKDFAPKGEVFEKAIVEWKKLPTDPGASFDRTIEIDAASIEPQVTWGTSPEQVLSIGSIVPDPAHAKTDVEKQSIARALDYMGLQAGQKITDIAVDTVFIGSCTNSRIEDLRAAASVIKGRKVKDGIRALVVPGSGRVKEQAEAEGLDRIFSEAGFQWRLPGCSMCLAMNDDFLEPGERSASTSNRNFEGRQGRGGRTHLVGPEMAAAAAIAGKFVDVRSF